MRETSYRLKEKWWRLKKAAEGIEKKEVDSVEHSGWLDWKGENEKTQGWLKYPDRVKDEQWCYYNNDEYGSIDRLCGTKKI